MQIRAAKFDVREIGEAGRFTGYAAVFGNRDSYGTITDKGAFARTIQHNGGKFPIVWFHDPTVPIGMAQVAEDDVGLFVNGELDLEVEAARNVYSGMQKGYIDRMSFAFDVVQQEDVDGVMHFKELKLYEVSPITRNFAANELALITEVRSRKLDTLPDEVAEAIRRAGQAAGEPEGGKSADFDTNLKGRELRQQLWQIFDALVDSIYDTMQSEEITDKAAKVGENVDAFREAIVNWASAADEAGIFEERAAALQEIRSALAEAKRVGKVLSKANREKVEAAIAAMGDATTSLQALLEAADAADSAKSTPSQGSEPAGNDPDGERQDPPEADPSDPEVHSLEEIISELRTENLARREEESRRRLEAIVSSLRKE